MMEEYIPSLVSFEEKEGKNLGEEKEAEIVIPFYEEGILYEAYLPKDIATQYIGKDVPLNEGALDGVSREVMVKSWDKLGFSPNAVIPENVIVRACQKNINLILGKISNI